jgi:hypothetical protein
VRFGIFAINVLAADQSEVADWFGRSQLKRLQRSQGGRWLKPLTELVGRSAQILLKNSNFRFDHNSEDRWRP